MGLVADADDERPDFRPQIVDPSAGFVLATDAGIDGPRSFDRRKVRVDRIAWSGLGINSEVSMDIVVYAVLMVAIVSPLVLMHEFGHYAAARLSGVRVVRFNVGTGPVVFARDGRADVTYAIRAVPLGGFCQVDQSSHGEARPSARLFFSVAGSGLNFLFAGVLLLFVALVEERGATVVDVVEGPALQAGLRSGDRVVSVDGEAVERWREVGVALVKRIGDTGAIEMRAMRDGRPVSLAVPIADWLMGVRQIDPFGALGMRRGDGEALSPTLARRVFDGVGDAIVAGFATAEVGIRMILGEVSILNFGGALWLGMLGEDNADLLTGEDRGDLSWTTWVRLIALLSIGLGVINLLPGPVVDGAAVISACVALALGRPISERAEKGIVYVGSVFAFGPLVLCIVYETMAVL